MCIASKDFKFCTCEEEYTDELPHYWKLYRFNKDKNLHIVGSIREPKDNLDPSFAHNRNTIRKRLNGENAFDKDMGFLENDVLVIVLNNNTEKVTTYLFEYKRGFWAECEYGYGWMWLKSRFDFFGFGVIKNLIK